MKRIHSKLMTDQEREQFRKQQEKNEESRRKSRKKPKIERRTYGELKMWRGQIVEK